MKKKNVQPKRDISALVEQYYSEFAAKYKSQIISDKDPTTWVPNEATRAAFSKRIAFETELFHDFFLNKNGLVLDAGCCFGRQSFILARSGFNVIACDLCQSFIDIGKTLTFREGLSVDFVRMDVKKL